MCNNRAVKASDADIRKAATGDNTVASAPRLTWGIGIRQVRITCGLILFSYLLSHFANHALGNVSYAVMTDWLDVHMAFWQHPVVAAIFYTAGITHWSLGLWALYQRRQFRYRLPEWTQLVLGLSIPFLLVSHFVGARLQSPLFGRDVYYAQVFNANWISHPYMEWVQFTLLVACARLHRSLLLAAVETLLRVRRPTLVAATRRRRWRWVGAGRREFVAFAEVPEWRALNLSRRCPGPQRVLDEIASVLDHYPSCWA
jgi:adenylate cyclase